MLPLLGISFYVLVSCIIRFGLHGVCITSWILLYILDISLDLHVLVSGTKWTIFFPIPLYWPILGINNAIFYLLICNGNPFLLTCNTFPTALCWYNFIWNIQGAKKAQLQLEVGLINRKINPGILFLIETMVNEHNTQQIIRAVGFRNLISFYLTIMWVEYGLCREIIMWCLTLLLRSTEQSVVQHMKKY